MKGCYAAFNSKEALTKHVELRHKPRICDRPRCRNKEFPSEAKKLEHIGAKHTTPTHAFKPHQANNISFSVFDSIRQDLMISDSHRSKANTAL